MSDYQITSFLARAVNTSCKLAIVLRFADQPTLVTTASSMATRICRDILSVQEALDELVEDQVLTVADGKYACAASTELRKTLQLLRSLFVDPLQRDQIYSLIRDLERYAPYRKELRAMPALERSIAA